MTWMQSFSLVMRSNLTTLREKVEDPERMIHQLIIDMEEEHERVRASVAAAIADEILLKKRVTQSRTEAEEWLERAANALRNGDEVSSKAALEQKSLAAERAESLEVEHQKQVEQTRSLQRSVGDLDDKIRQAKQKQTLLLARLTRSRSQQKIEGALRKANSRSAFAQFSRLEDRVDKTEAMNEAYERLDGKDPDAEELKRKFEEDERRKKVEDDLKRLRARIDGEKREGS